MTTMELEAQKAMLAREILSIDNMEQLKKVKAYLVRIGAKSTKLQKVEEDEVEEDLTPYTMEEINSWIDEAEAEEEAGIEGTPHKVVMQEMRQKHPWLCKYQ